jgi:chromosome segregation ATPase
MKPEPVNGRELLAELRALQAEVRAFRDLMDERDRRYTERAESDDRARGAALTAVKEQTASAFAASKEAITKSEMNQTTYNATHNDLTRKMDSQYAAMLPRTEADNRFQAIEEKIADLREARSHGGGKEEALQAAHVAQRWALGIGLSLLLFLAGNVIIPLIRHAP